MDCRRRLPACIIPSPAAVRLMAMWLLQAGIVQFYDAQGTTLRTVNLLKKLRPQPVAALSALARAFAHAGRAPPGLPRGPA